MSVKAWDQAPVYLLDQNLKTITELMVGLPGDTRFEPAHYSLESEEFSLFRYWEFDTSFARQINDLVRNDPPDGYVVTATSAIPVGDAIRGYYDGIGEETPPITTIAAGRLSAHQYFDYDIYSNIYASDSVPTPERISVDEIERLRNFSAGMGHVCAIDQFVHTGATITFAGVLLREAGVEQITAMPGTWYKLARGEDIRPDEVSSVYADEFYQIGLQSASTGM